MQSLQPGYHALVIGSSGGIGAAFLGLLRQDARCAQAEGLSRASHPGFDLADAQSIERAAADLNRLAPFDLILDATGALTIDGTGPEKAIRALDAEAMARQFAVNAIGPALLLKHFLPFLARGRRAIFASLSARVGSIGDNRLGGWVSYRASKAALNQIIRTVSIELSRTHPEALLVALHPGTVATRLSEPFAGNRDRLEPEQSARMLLDVLDGISAEASGSFLAYDGTKIEW
jgi:NAD(P)-dependent dehydrogenase (short-subunit alcohol dehydrogenase family)